jgi:hypothetical protein
VDQPVEEGSDLMPARHVGRMFRVPHRSLFAPSTRVTLAMLLLFGGCAGPSLEEQKRQIQNQNLQLRLLTSEAFLGTWGHPTYQYEALVQFYPLNDGQLVPSFLVPTGEAPPNWDSTILSGVGRFFAYADQGEVLGFLDNRLVYRAHVLSADVHRLGKVWAAELKFRTRTEAEFLQRR